MDIFQDFSKKDFIEQVKILQDIEDNRMHGAIPELFELCKTKDPNDQVQFMAQNTLRALLFENEEQTVNGLKLDSDNIKNVCLQVVAQKSFKSAAPTLIDLASQVSGQASDHVSGQTDSNTLFEILNALSKIDTPQTLETFKKHLRHSDPLISELSIEAIGAHGDLTSVDELTKIIEESEADDRYEACEIITASAIEALGKIKTDSCLSFLASKIHHKNPTSRRFVHQTLAQIGPEVISFIEPSFIQNDMDKKIMAVNILGQIGGEKAGDILVNVVDKGGEDDPNIMFAIYEALGNIPSMKSLVCLTDALTVKDELMLLTVVSSLNNLINPGIAGKFKELINAENELSQRIIQSIVASKALSIFEYLYEDDKIADKLIEGISNSNDEDIITAFTEKLKLMEGEKTLSDVKRLTSMATDTTGKKILAVDDSNSMLHFYKTIVSGMGMIIRTAINGMEALEILKKGEEFDLILTDMNMPVMDGIEMTKNVRANPSMGKIPIIMATTESEKSQSELAQNAGVNNFIKKPFTADQLKEYINKSFGQ